MDLPRPGPAHDQLFRLEGRFVGDEVLSPWGPGGNAVGRSELRRGLDGIALLQYYVEEKDGQVVFRGHGVFLVEPGSGDVLWWWFDSMGFPPEGPARGRWVGDELRFEKSGGQGESRYLFAPTADGYRFRIENRIRGQDDFAEFMRGEYRRV